MATKKMPRKNLDNQKLRDGELTPEDLDGKELNSNTYKSTASSRLNKDRVNFGTNGRPSKAQMALIERYKVETNKGLVNNTIDEIISEKILDIREVINNMIDYGDPSIFKVLPKELDDKIRSYGLCAQEHFGKKMSKMDGAEVYIVPVSFIYCPKCKTFKHEQNFYSSKNDLYNGNSNICKDCATEMFMRYFAKYKDIKECLILISYKLDMLVYEPVLTKYVEYYHTEDGKKDLFKEMFLSKYISDTWLSIKINEIPEDECSFCNSNLNGIPFKCINRVFVMPEIYNDKFVEESEDDEFIDKTSERGFKKLKRKWGNLEREELLWLEEKSDEWHNNYDIQGKSRELLVEQLCLEELTLFKNRQKGGDVSKQLKNIQDMMKSSDLSPKKQTTSSALSEFASLADFVKKVETIKPIVNKDPVFEDVDGITKLWKSIAGAICRTAGKQSELIQDFEENFAEHTVDFMDDSIGEDVV